MYPYDQELGNKYIININSGLIQVSEVLVIYFIRQNLVLWNILVLLVLVLKVLYLGILK
jgi:hypothetical protein